MNLEDLAVVGFILVSVALIVVYLPAIAVAEADCLAKGYPKAQITWNLKSYCTTLDGAVTVRVERQK